MKKFTLLSVLIVFTVFLYSQNITSSNSFKKSSVTENNNNKGTKAIVDILNYDGSNDDGFGMGSPVSFGAYAFHSVASLASHAASGNTITSIRIYLQDIADINSLEIRFYSDQSTMIYNQATSGLVAGWNDIALTTPYAITATDLYVGYFIDASGGYPAGIDAGPADSNGDWLVYSGTWYHINELSAFDCNWNIRAVVEGALPPNNDATLSDLQFDGSTVSGFSPATFTYNEELPYGTTIVPTVAATLNDANASMIITDAASLPGSTTVEVTAEDGTTIETYTINFTIALPNTDATLSDLRIDGSTVSGFSPSTFTYNEELPYGTIIVPTVTATLNDANASMIITDAASLPGSTTVEVTAEDGTTTETYTINFTIALPNTDATLSDLQIDGSTVSGFSPSTFTYNEELPYGTTIVPTVTATLNDANASMVINDAASLPGSATVLVTAEDGSTTETYTINFTIALPNTDATLSDLQSDGFTVSGFSSTVYVYDIELPYGTTIVPTVTATLSDINANMVITDAPSLPGSTTVEVTAEDGSTTETYTINYSIATSINEVISDKINIYPNPTKGIINVACEYNATIKIIDISGRIVSFIEANKGDNIFNLKKFEKGVYVVEIQTISEIITSKIVLQ